MQTEEGHQVLVEAPAIVIVLQFLIHDTLLDAI
jgi:hypothetical protein